MAANRLNYIVIYQNESQVFGTASKDVALSTPPPDGTPISEKRVFFITFQPDNEVLSVHRISQEEVENSELIYTKKRKDKKNA